MIHMATRKIIRSGRSKVIGLPQYVVNALGIQAGDTFVILFDDERKTITAQAFTLGGVGPGVNLDGLRVDTVLMP
jgi:hypothetical protein